MSKRSLKFKMIAIGVLAVLVPLIVVGGFSIYRSMNALEDVSKSQSMEVAKGLAHMANLAVQEEMKIITQAAQRDVVIATAANPTDEAVLNKVAEELKAMVEKSGNDYEIIFITDIDGKVITGSRGLANKGLDLSGRDYFREAKGGKTAVGSVVKSKATGNTVLTFAAPIYSNANQIIGVAGSTVRINFLSDKIAATKLGQTGYGYVIDKTGLLIAHPSKELILQINATQTEGMKGFAARMVAGETGVDPYVFKGVRKIAGFAPVPLAGWSVCVTQDYSEFMAPAYHLLWFILIIGLIFLAVTVAGVFVFARGIATPIGRIAGELDSASEQVAAASSQVASAGQSLAEGASEQASALEETSSSLEEMSSMTKQNADNAAQAKALTGEAKQIVNKVDGQMQHMVTAIQEVTKSSEETGKIIKTIDEIAFQTNLLALNAAVEAARAGEAGAGFAVVADEVRNLAMRAAEAAKNTSSLIENTIITVKNSRDLTEQTQNAFKENVAISNKIGQLIDEIAAASAEQAQGIGQIGKAVAEMDKVVQSTAANAEESASAAEEMNAQAEQMKGYVDKLVEIIDGNGNGASESFSHLSGEAQSAASRQTTKPTVRRLLAAGSAVSKRRASVRPDEVIPFDKEGFRDF
ncbi:MAG: methyl-accepting chemotaxis protein [Deltaproteobacteria bacterium]